MEKINVLVVGSGGREHALAWKLKQSPQAGTVYVAPGNPGTAMLGCQNIPLSADPKDQQMLAELARHYSIELAVIGPDNALADGIVLYLKNRGIPTFGPVISSIIESSKIFGKLLMKDVGIPTAPFVIFTDPELAVNYVRQKGGNVVVKADGLAHGKGVRVCPSIGEALTAIDDFMVNETLGKAGKKIVIEDLLDGDELSIHALCDGEHVKLFPAVRDHKNLLDGNKGPMTGGMGVFGPIDVEPGLMERVEKEIVLPCVRELARRGMSFVGCLYPGIMLTKDGPKVLEFNARFGDPETQVYMRLLEDDVDLVEVLLACTQGRLDQVELRWKKSHCICIVAAAHGYPGDPRKGDAIKITSPRLRDSDRASFCFHAGTAWSDGVLVTNGGRVLSFATLLPCLKDIPVAYNIFENEMFFDGMQYRKDIGKV